MPSRKTGLTKAQFDMLDRAVRHPSGNPWYLIGVRRRAGGAMHRMFERMKKAGLFSSGNVITPLGREVHKTENARCKP